MFKTHTLKFHGIPVAGQDFSHNQPVKADVRALRMASVLLTTKPITTIRKLSEAGYQVSMEVA